MSTSSRFVRLILSEYGYQTELAEEQPWEKRRDFLTLNPAGTLPVYVDDSMPQPMLRQSSSTMPMWLTLNFRMLFRPQKRSTRPLMR